MVSSDDSESSSNDNNKATTSSNDSGSAPQHHQLVHKEKPFPQLSVPLQDERDNDNQTCPDFEFPPDLVALAGDLNDLDDLSHDHKTALIPVEFQLLKLYIEHILRHNKNLNKSVIPKPELVLLYKCAKVYLARNPGIYEKMNEDFYNNDFEVFVNHEFKQFIEIYDPANHWPIENFENEAVNERVGRYLPQYCKRSDKHRKPDKFGKVNCPAVE